MARLYSNENFPFPAVEELRRLGHEVTTIQETGTAGAAATDDEVLRFATAERRALLTMNRRHFVRRHMLSQDHAGIIVCTFDPDFVSQARRIHARIAAAPTLTGQLIRVNRPRR